MRALSWLGEVLLAGLLTLLPIYLTIQVLVTVFHFIDSEVGKLLEPLLGQHVPGSGVVLTFLLVLVMGVLTKFWLTQRLIDFGEDLLQRIPGLGQLYRGIKRLLDPFTKKEERPFREAVWIPVSPEMDALGFITSGELETNHEDGEGRVSVFLPSCHPYLGMVTVAKRSDLRKAPIGLDEAVSYELSFGAAAPPQIKLDEESSRDQTAPHNA